MEKTFEKRECVVGGMMMFCIRFDPIIESLEPARKVRKGESENFVDFETLVWPESFTSLAFLEQARL
jgi:hypothetical protein